MVEVLRGTDDGQTGIQNWASEEANRLDAEAKKAREEKGYREFYSWRKGENHFTLILGDKPREIESKFGRQKVFQVKAQDGLIYDLAVSTRSPVYRILVHAIRDGETNLNILKSGEGKETRYEKL